MIYQKITKDIGIIGFTSIILALKGLIILPVITKTLGAESYGMWAQIIVTFSLIIPLATIGLPYTLVRFLAAEKNKKEIQDGIYSVLTLVVLVSIFFAAILIILSEPIADFLGGERILINVLAFIVIFECINVVFLNIFRAFQQMKKYSFFVLFQAFGEAGLVVVTVLLGYGIFGAVLSLLIIRLINFLIMGSYIVRKIGIKIPQFLRMREYLRFGIPAIPSNVSFWVVHVSDRYLIGYFLGVLSVGYYAPGYTLGYSINLFIGPLLFVLPAALSKFFDENKILEVKIVLQYSLKYFLAIAIPSTLGLSILSKQLLMIFSTEKIAQQGYLIVPIVAFGTLLFGLHAILFQALSLMKKTMIGAKIWFGIALLNFGLNLIFIPNFGIIGAAIATFVAYSFLFIFTWHYSFKYIEFEIDWKFILKSILASIIMSLFILWLNPIGLLSTLIAIILGAISYGILFFLFRGFGKKEIYFLRKFLDAQKSD